MWFKGREGDRRQSGFGHRCEKTDAGEFKGESPVTQTITRGLDRGRRSLHWRVYVGQPGALIVRLGAIQDGRAGFQSDGRAQQVGHVGWATKAAFGSCRWRP